MDDFSIKNKLICVGNNNIQTVDINFFLSLSNDDLEKTIQLLCPFTASSIAQEIKTAIEQIPKEKRINCPKDLFLKIVPKLEENSVQEIHDKFLKLLKASVNSDKIQSVHPCYIDILNQMSPDEARFLNKLSPTPNDSYPIIGVYFQKDKNYTVPTEINFFTNLYDDVLTDKEEIQEVLSNLSRLGIIIIQKDEWVTNEEFYTAIEASKKIQDKLAIQKPSGQYKTKHMLFEKTTLGQNLQLLLI